jgi:hypothetical protein
VGVGGLLKIWDYYTGNHFCSGYDGNGDMVALTARVNRCGVQTSKFDNCVAVRPP